MKAIRLTLERKKSVAGMLFTLPFTIGFITLFAYPVLLSIIFSVSNMTVDAKGYKLEYVGLLHYTNAFFVHPQFNQTFVNSIVTMVLEVPLIIIFSFFIASLLNQQFSGRTLARAVFFLPVIMASGVVMKMESLDVINNVLLHGSSAEGTLANQAIQSFQLSQYLDRTGLSPKVIDYLIGTIDRIYQVINLSGVQILILLAALQSIPRSLYEASMIEGATGWESFWKITFPMVSPYILTITVYSMIDNFTSYRNSVMTLINEVSINNFNYVYGTAMAWIYFIAIAMILAIIIPLLNKKVFYYE